jgi:hypothetical protein
MKRDLVEDVIFFIGWTIVLVAAWHVSRELAGAYFGGSLMVAALLSAHRPKKKN